MVDIPMLFHSKNIASDAFLVTGGAGFIGSHIAEYLLKNGAGKVRVLDNLVNGFETNLAILKQYPAFEFMEGDIRNADTCQAACKGMDYVSHQAALGSVPRSIKEPVYFNEVNVGGFVNILKASVDHGIKQLVYASSSSVYGDEPTLPKKEEKTGRCLSPYAATKKTNELYAQVFADVYGLKIMGFRYFNIFGPRQDPDGPYAAVIPLFVKGILKRIPVYINGDGEQTRDFTFVENAVQINIKGMLTGNEAALNKVYNVAVGDRFSVNYLYETCKSQLNSDWEATYREPRHGDIRHSQADISLAKGLLDYQPTKNFEAGLIDTIDYFKTVYSN
ncbi:MAG TPA: SDR family oxidoreductase [Ferruginibacter sp.]|nr:SDR family oxidoreductase [Bacteroidota bacterium]MBS1925263.1 SDR family oxidoreductase [Bacteroidota bacterium]MCC6693312.1 SDR family oxidoreductase [Chitinophagaceae bacterium]HMT95832.1 SDR family oxidoreductase [Ferruginibacter sp.]HMU24267.1 SDR family oxidoreductase [Ferruginibacter sp.]